ncbi:sialic acid-binding Ig-like lectin 10 [Brachionichthys hirsutus]|uniref:sialic acid-binding Ig-like lectin 10 n=1 Tax=Brachionichthys hirsutus TaxID=412623 RepID=UPI0036043365
MISVKALTQKPTVTTPPLTEGRWATLTCAAPGLCSGSVPKFTWTWGGTGKDDGSITGNTTDYKTKRLTDFTRRHSSTFKFNPSVAQQNGTEITCKVTFANNITTETTVILTVRSSEEAARGGSSETLPWSIVAVSLLLNVVCIICVIVLWSSRKKEKPSQEEKTYMALEKRRPSLEYDVLRHPRRIENQITMIVLIWAAGILFWRGCHADTDFTLVPRARCQKGFCIYLTETITAEAGLCIVIPCFFYTGSGFTPQNMVWFKCEQSKPKCIDSDMILHPNMNKKTQPGFRGRVSLLEPDARRRNCSIAISDLTESDSGSYQLRVNGLSWRGNQDGFSFPYGVAVTVKALTQKPTVTTPPLTAGRPTTLTCTAPGLCSGSVPKFTWTWRGSGKSDPYITDYDTESLTSIARTHASTLTFNPSAEDHNTNVTCEVSFANITTTEETVTLTVSYVKELKITGDATVKESETLNLTCGVESFPPSVITWNKVTGECTQTGTERTPQDDAETCLQGGEGGSTGSLSISNVSAEHTGQYICTAKYLNNTLMKRVNVTVTYMRTLTITGHQVVVEGDALNLTCGVQSVPLSRITWSRNSSNAALSGEPDAGPQGSAASVTLWISNVTGAHSGRYDCTARYLDGAVTLTVTVTVTSFPKILKGSGCRVQSGVMTCVCVSEGLPLPTIGWPLLNNLSEYRVITTVSKHTVNSTAVLSVKQHRNKVAECASSNQNGLTTEILSVCTDASPPEDQSREESTIIYWLEIIIAFLIGILLSAFICYLVTKYRRIKLRSFGNLDETVEMVTNQEDPLIDAGQAVEADQTYYQDIAEERSRAVAVTKAATNHDADAGDLEYASIDFSLLKRKREIPKKRETSVTEYSEIRVTKEEREEFDGEEGKENEVMMGEDEETAEERGRTLKEDVDDVYSNPKDVKD